MKGIWDKINDITDEIMDSIVALSVGVIIVSVAIAVANALYLWLRTGGM